MYKRTRRNLSWMKKLSGVILYFIFIAGAIAQNTTIDSLKNLLPEATDEEKIAIYHELGLSHRGISYPLVKLYSLKSYKYSKKLNRPQAMINSLSSVAIACVYIGKLDSAGRLFNEILYIADSVGDFQQRNKALLNLGNFYLNTNNYDLALENYQLVYPEYLKMKDTLNMAGIEENIGGIHYHQRNYRKALQAFFLASALYENSGYQDESKLLLNNIGLTYLKLNLSDSALFFLEKGLIYFRSKNNLESEMRIQNNLGLLFLEKGDYSLAVRYFQHSIQLSKEIVNPYQEANGLLNLAQVFIKQRLFDSAFIYLNQAEHIINIQGDNLLLKELYEYYYEVYYQQSQYEKALSYFQKYNAVQDSIFSKEIQNRISSLNIRFETAKKEAENIRLKSELDLKQITQRKLTLTLVIISLLFVSLTVAFFFIWKFLKQKNTIAKQESLLLTERLEHSQKELASKALHLASQNEFRIKLLEMTNEVYDHLDQAGKQNINIILKNLENTIDQSAWHEFETRFEHVQEAFFTKLNIQFPDLTPNDRRMCAFLKMNMSTKDIALLTHRSPRSIESSRYRLKKKFGLGPDEEILPFLQSI